MGNILDQIIEDQNRRNVQPASAAQIGAATGVAGAAAPITPTITIAPNSAEIEAGGRSFFNQPSMWEQNLSPAQQRQELSLDTLRTVAAQRRFDLERAHQTAPAQDALLEAQIAASGSHDRYLRDQDAQVATQTAGFLNALTGKNAPGVDSADFDTHVLSALKNFPRAAETPGGRAILEQLGKIRKTHSSIADMTKSIPGMEVGGVTLGPNGPSYNMRPVNVNRDRDTELRAMGLTPKLFSHPVDAQVGSRKGGQSFTQDNLGNMIRFRNKEGKFVEMSIDAYESLGGVLGKETIEARKGIGAAGAAPSAAPIKKYNPKTGRLE